jgi:ferredoxin-NADP reductase
MAQHTIALRERKTVADGTELFVFEKPEGYTFAAGQYVALIAPKVAGIESDTRGLVRSFSLVAAPCEPTLAFAMRSSESAFKKTFWQLVPGDTVTITDPVGSFILPPEADARPIVFLVGGIGITPIWSILKQAAHEQSQKKFTLLYANRFLKDAAFYQELEALSLPHFRHVTVLSKSEEPCAPADDERGYICEALIAKYVDDMLGSLYYLVGSPQFIQAMEKMLNDLGVPKEQCKQDPFTGLSPQTKS